MRNENVLFARSVAPLSLAFFTAALFLSSSLPAVAQQTTSSAPALVAQDAVPVNLPDAPGFLVVAAEDGQSSSQKPPAAQNSTPQTQGQGQDQRQAPAKRLFFIIPNFRSVNTSTVLPPQTVRQKFSDASKDTFDYSAVALDVLVAAYNYARSNTPEFGTGGLAYGRYLWHSAADQSVENYLVEFIVPAVTHEDTRFYLLDRGPFTKRALYAITRTFVTKSDSGHETANLGELVGAAAAAGISQTYYPRPERTVGNFLGQYGTDLLIDSAAYFLREFEPEFSRAIARKAKVSR